ncbi:hypothetical protein [Yersinia ruckeri]|uniref:hypothetical protein n=1 Tax=Yersinia ruckeri TaxID=29486 RepID=UPI0022383F12|nr:hypothetical protein [Yersinia ruckeri]MCW6598636.1 hypothetical protein [Yersinia ruckeri]
MADSSNNRYLIKPQIFRSNEGSNVQAEFFIVDTDTREYVTDNIVGLVELKFASGSTAFEIDFDEYFATEPGSFVVSFFNLPDYPISEILITATINGQTVFSDAISLNDADVLKENILDFNGHSDA